jgi:CubicO group peptidase (beta-lactamase class C family)
MMQPAIQIEPGRLERAFAVVDAAVQAAEIPSGVLAVATGKEVVRVAAFSRPGGDQVSADHIFLLASISKPILATAVMQLVEDGLLFLAEPLTRYIPEFAQPGKAPVTAWHLLTHTSGLEEMAWIDALGLARVPAFAYVQAACRSNLHFPPGTRFEYCTLSYSLLAELITRLTGVPYPDYLQARIFTPLGMADTSFDPGKANAARTAPAHNTEDWLDYYKTLQVPGGGLWSTAADLVRFGQAFLNDGKHGDYHLLAPATIALMTRDHTDGLPELIEGQAKPAHAGLGWRKPTLSGPLPGSPATFSHAGATGTYLWIDPEWDLVVVFLTNQWDIATPVHFQAIQAVYGALRRPA